MIIPCCKIWEYHMWLSSIIFGFLALLLCFPSTVFSHGEITFLGWCSCSDLKFVGQDFHLRMTIICFLWYVWIILWHMVMWLYSQFAYHQVMLCCSFSTLRNLCSVQRCQSWWAHQNKVSHNYHKNGQYNWVKKKKKTSRKKENFFVLMSPRTHLEIRPISVFQLHII